MKKHVYLFDETSRAFVYGIGTYIRQMIDSLKDRDELVLHAVHIGGDIKDFEIKKMDGYDLYNIPHLSIPWQGSLERYQRNISYFICLNCEYSKEDKFVFIFNFYHHLHLINHLKKKFPMGTFYHVIHYQDWCFSLNGNVERLNQIIRTEDIRSLSDSDQRIYESFIKEKELYQTVDKVICLSGFTLSLLNEVYGISRDKLVLIYNGLKDDGTIITAEQRNLLKKQYHFSSKEKIILFVGRLDAIKGVETLILSFQDLLKTHENYRLIVIGDGNFSSCLNKCETSWKQVTFTGRLDKKQLYDFYQIADIGVMPSMHEQCSYVAIEMMMFALPMVVSTTTGLKEMIRNGEFGYTFNMEEGSEESKNKLVDLVSKVLEAPSWKRKGMKSLSRSFYEERFSVQEMQKKYLDLILTG